MIQLAASTRLISHLLVVILDLLLDSLDWTNTLLVGGLAALLWRVLDRLIFVSRIRFRIRLATIHVDFWNCFKVGCSSLLLLLGEWPFSHWVTLGGRMRDFVFASVYFPLKHGSFLNLIRHLPGDDFESGLAIFTSRSEIFFVCLWWQMLKLWFYHRVIITVFFAFFLSFLAFSYPFWFLRHFLDKISSFLFSLVSEDINEVRFSFINFRL